MAVIWRTSGRNPTERSILVTNGKEQWSHTPVPNFSEASIAIGVLIIAPNYPRKGARRNQKSRLKKTHFQGSLGELEGEDADSILNKKFLHECPMPLALWWKSFWNANHERSPSTTLQGAGIAYWSNFCTFIDTCPDVMVNPFNGDNGIWDPFSMQISHDAFDASMNLQQMWDTVNHQPALDNSSTRK